MKEFKYGKISPGLSGKTGPIVMFLTIFVLACVAIITTGRLDSAIGGSLILAVAYSILIWGFSFWPNIKCDQEALYLEFVGWPIKIPWDDILDLKRISYLPQTAWLVTAKRITVIHYSYGLLFSFRLVPGFLIWRSMPNHSELLAYIKRNIKTKQHVAK